MSDQADFMRDVLGLDHLTKIHRKNRTVLGFMAFRSDHLADKADIRRPTAFDQASSYRFRGISPKDVPKVGQWGYTTDLYKLYQAYRSGTKGAYPSIVGSAEAVMNNPMLDGGRKVLLGYLGDVKLPRGDTNDRVPDIHTLYREQYLGCPNADKPYQVLK